MDNLVDCSVVCSFRNMEDVVRFPDLKPSKQLSYPIRQLISREIELEKVRRAETYFVNQKLVRFDFTVFRKCN